MLDIFDVCIGNSKPYFQRNLYNFPKLLITWHCDTGNLIREIASLNTDTPSCSLELNTNSSKFGNRSVAYYDELGYHCVVEGI